MVSFTAIGNKVKIRISRKVFLRGGKCTFIYKHIPTYLWKHIKTSLSQNVHHKPKAATYRRSCPLHFQVCLQPQVM